MAERNIYLGQLENNKEIQKSLLELLKVTNPFFVFDKEGQLEFFADRAMFIGTQPAEGQDYNKAGGAAQEPVVFSHELGFVLKRRYSAVTNRDIEKMALESPEKLNELFAQIIKDITNRAHYELLTKCVQLVCTDANYRTTALTAKPITEYKNPAQVLRWLNDMRSFMCSPSQTYNKGFKTTIDIITPVNIVNPDGTIKTRAGGIAHGANSFVPVLSNSYSTAELVLIIDPSVYNMLEEEIFSNRFHYDLSQLEKKFGLVIQVPLTYDALDITGQYAYQFIILDKNAFALRYIIRKGIESQYNPENLQTSFFLHNWIIAGSIPFHNQVGFKLSA